MCPACARKLKAAQIDAARDGAERDPDSGMMCTALDSLRAGKLHRNNTSGVRGVTWYAPRKKWQVRVEIDKKTRTIGYYSTIEEAAEARAKAVLKLYGPKSEK